MQPPQRLKWRRKLAIYRLLNVEIFLVVERMPSPLQPLVMKAQVEKPQPDGDLARALVAMDLQLIDHYLDLLIRCVVDRKVPALEINLPLTEVASQSWVPVFRGIPRYRLAQIVRLVVRLLP